MFKFYSEAFPKFVSVLVTEKLYFYLCYIKCATLIVKVVEIPWPNTGASHYHAQLGLTAKGGSIKELVV